MWMVWVILGLGCNPAVAGSADREAQAEAYRLSEEVDRLVKKGAWSGVERLYISAVKTGAPLSHDTHISGARSSMQRGDARSARSRLLAAYEVERDPATLEWLTTYSRQYTQVTLRADAGAELQVERRHFDQERARVVDRAVELLKTTGQFDGLLPMGRYRVGAFWFTIKEDNEDIKADLRACIKTASCVEPSPP